MSYSPQTFSRFEVKQEANIRKNTLCGERIQSVYDIQVNSPPVALVSDRRGLKPVCDNSEPIG